MFLGTIHQSHQLILGQTNESTRHVPSTHPTSVCHVCSPLAYAAEEHWLCDMSSCIGPPMMARRGLTRDFLKKRKLYALLATKRKDTNGFVTLYLLNTHRRATAPKLNNITRLDLLFHDSFPPQRKSTRYPSSRAQSSVEWKKRLKPRATRGRPRRTTEERARPCARRAEVVVNGEN